MTIRQSGDGFGHSLERCGVPDGERRTKRYELGMVLFWSFSPVGIYTTIDISPAIEFVVYLVGIVAMDNIAFFADAIIDYEAHRLGVSCCDG